MADDSDTDPLKLAYELLDTGADQLGRDGLVAVFHPLEDHERTVVVYERTGVDVAPDAEDASLHLRKEHEWSAEEVEQIYWASEGIDPTITADSGPAAEFCR